MEAAIPEKFYLIIGILIITNLGVFVTLIGAGARIVYRFAVLETQVKALHRRLDQNNEGE